MFIALTDQVFCSLKENENADQCPQGYRRRQKEIFLKRKHYAMYPHTPY